MKKGQREGSSYCLEEKHWPRLKDRDSQCGQSPNEHSSDEEMAVEADWEGECTMKRSQGFSSSFGFGEKHQEQSNDTDTKDGQAPLKDSNGISATVMMELELVAEMEKVDAVCEPPQLSGFRPQELWLSMTRCLSFKWPVCLSLNRQCERKIAYQADLDQSESTPSLDTSDSTNGSSLSTSISDNKDEGAGLVENRKEEVRKGRAGPFSAPGVPRARLATDSVLGSVWLDREMVLRVELLDMGEESGHRRYRAEWRLSDKNKELAQGVWLSQSRKPWTD